MVRLQAQIDQLAAAARERAAEIADLRARMAELARRIDAVNARWRRERLWTWVAALYGAAIGVGITWLMR
jgi:hypothetical protein